MFEKRFAKIVLFALTVFVGGATGVSAQGESCGLIIEVKRSDNEAALTGATATAVNTETKKVFRSAVRRGMPFFAELSEGEYEITVSKPGYKKSFVDGYVVSCAQTEDGALRTSVPLWRGNSKLTVSVNDEIQTTEPAAKFDPNRKIDTDSSSTIGEAGASVSNDSPRTISGGVLNGKAINLVKPAYPVAARAVEASGAVNVQVTIDEEGNVISAVAVSGHPLLRASAVKAARESKFAPTRLSGQLVKVTGIIVYNFVP